MKSIERVMHFLKTELAKRTLAPLQGYTLWAPTQSVALGY
jgi:hypothetical protein